MYIMCQHVYLSYLPMPVIITIHPILLGSCPSNALTALTKAARRAELLIQKKDRLIWCELNQQYRKYGRVGGFFSHEESCMA